MGFGVSQPRPRASERNRGLNLVIETDGVRCIQCLDLWRAVQGVDFELSQSETKACAIYLMESWSGENSIRRL